MSIYTGLIIDHDWNLSQNLLPPSLAGGGKGEGFDFEQVLVSAHTVRVMAMNLGWTSIPVYKIYEAAYHR
jgi:hypothetical protein